MLLFLTANAIAKQAYRSTHLVIFDFSTARINLFVRVCISAWPLLLISSPLLLLHEA